MTSNTTSTTEETRRLDQALADAMTLVWKVLEQLPIEERLASITKCRTIFDGIETKTIARQIDDGVPTRKIEDALHRSAGGRTSKRTIKKKARRGAVSRENPALATKLAKGEMSDEQVDVIAEASAKTKGAAAHDEELINKVAAAPPEQGKKLADEFVREQMSQDDLDDAHKRARMKRRVTRYSNPERGTDTLSIEGSPTDIDEIEARIDQLADRYYRDDGGRDLAPNKHRRTRDQRRFDAAHTMLLQNAGPAQPATTPTSSATTPTSSATTPRATIVIRASLDQAIGKDQTPVTLADGAPLPTSTVERLACGADFIGQVFGAKGEVLWQGRKTRHATPAQRVALAVRDQGCVQCQASIDRCVAHHLLPWHSQLEGETNIDELALVCDDCHHHIHDNDLTLRRDEGGIWRVRPAKANEVAPRRPPKPERVRRKRQTQTVPNAEGRAGP